jgi:MinD superfamily P-loop ATPase
MKELAVISGTGGTGKTSIVAAFATLAEGAVVADCDVDASYLHLVLTPRSVSRKVIDAPPRASIHEGACTACGLCRKLCRFNAIGQNARSGGNGASRYFIDPVACVGCGVCAWFCPEGAVRLERVSGGELFVSTTRYGFLVHARLDPAHGDSGGFVPLVLREARDVAARKGRDLVIVDGPRGTGHPAAASASGADLVLIVTEPTPAGAQGLARAAQLTTGLGIPTAVCVNKWDLNPDMTASIEQDARSRNVSVAGRIRHDPAVSQCQRMQATIIEYTGGAVSQDIRAVWERLIGISGSARRDPLSRVLLRPSGSVR